MLELQSEKTFFLDFGKKAELGDRIKQLQKQQKAQAPLIEKAEKAAEKAQRTAESARDKAEMAVAAADKLEAEAARKAEQLGDRG